MEPTSTKPSQLSCTNCRHRKVKCDKTSPCSACRRSNIECVFPTRPFKPRGRQGGSKARNVEITKRLNRLEGLMSTLGGEAAAQALLQVAKERDEALKSEKHERQRQSSSDSWIAQDHEPAVKADGSLCSDFWSNLSGEVSLPGMLLLCESSPSCANTGGGPRSFGRTTCTVLMHACRRARLSYREQALIAICVPSLSYSNQQVELPSQP